MCPPMPPPTSISHRHMSVLLQKEMEIWVTGLSTDERGLRSLSVQINPRNEVSLAAKA